MHFRMVYHRKTTRGSYGVSCSHICLKWLLVLPRESDHRTMLKLRVIQFAENSNNYAAGREFGVSEKLVRDWRKQVDVLREMAKTKRARRGDHQANFPALEASLYEWIVDLRH